MIEINPKAKPKNPPQQPGPVQGGTFPLQVGKFYKTETGLKVYVSNPYGDGSVYMVGHGVDHPELTLFWSKANGYSADGLKAHRIVAEWGEKLSSEELWKKYNEGTDIEYRVPGVYKWHVYPEYYRLSYLGAAPGELRKANFFSHSKMYEMRIKQ